VDWWLLLLLPKRLRKYAAAIAKRGEEGKNA